MESRTTVSIRARIGIVGLLAAVFGLGLSIPAFAAWTCSASFFCGYDEDNGVQRILLDRGGTRGRDLPQFWRPRFYGVGKKSHQSILLRCQPAALR